MSLVKSYSTSNTITRSFTFVALVTIMVILPNVLQLVGGEIVIGTGVTFTTSAPGKKYKVSITKTTIQGTYQQVTYIAHGTTDSGTSAYLFYDMLHGNTDAALFSVEESNGVITVSKYSCLQVDKECTGSQWSYSQVVNDSSIRWSDGYGPEMFSLEIDELA
jgi:hypothetical protein